MVDLTFDGLTLPSALDEIPVSRLVRFVGNALGLLVRFTIVATIEGVRVIDGQLSGLSLAHLSFLILINLDLFLHFFEGLGVHLCGGSVASYHISELELLALFS